MTYKNRVRQASMITTMRNLIARLVTVGSMDAAQYRDWSGLSKTACIEHLHLLMDYGIAKRENKLNGDSKRKSICYSIKATPTELEAFYAKLKAEASQYTVSRVNEQEAQAQKSRVALAANSRVVFYDPLALPREFFGAPAVAA